MDIDKNEVLVVSDKSHTQNQSFHSAPGFALLPVEGGSRPIKGSELVGLEYAPLFDYYAKDEKLKNRQNGWKIYAGEFVTTEDGTGIVHIAPGFGTDDWELSKREQLPFVQHVNPDGTFKSEVKDFAGREVKPIEDPSSADVEIVKYLAKKGTLFSKEK